MSDSDTSASRAPDSPSRDDPNFPSRVVPDEVAMPVSEPHAPGADVRPESPAGTPDERPPLFIWKGHSLTLAEAVEFFTLEENWNDGEANLFARPEDADALINFLRQTPLHHSDVERVSGVLSVMDQPAWQDIPVTARRTALTAAAWVALAGPEAHASLRVLGRGADWHGLQALFRANPTGASTPLFHALINPHYIALIEPLDAATARSLQLLAGSVTATFDLGFRLGLIAREALDEHAQIFALALESSKELEAHVKRLRSRFASHRTPELAALFTHPKPERWMLVLLAYVGERPAESGFVTHADQNLDNYRRLREEAETLSTVVFWERLGQALNTGPLIFPPWWIFAPFWIGLVAAVAHFSGDWRPAVGVASAILGLRLLSEAHVRKQVRNHGRTPTPWTWRDHAARCRRESARIRSSIIPPLHVAPSVRLAQISREVSRIPLHPTPAPPPPAPGFALLWSGSAISVLGALGLIASVAYPVLRDSAADAASGSPGPAETSATAASEDVPQFHDPPPGFPPGLYEAHSDGFGRTLRGPLMTWDVPPTAVGEPLELRGTEHATAEQVTYALIAGELLLKPYPSRGISALLAVRVPAGDRIGLMLYDGSARALASRDVFIVAHAPQPRTWQRLGNRNVVYLGVPETLAADLETGAPRR